MRRLLLTLAALGMMGLALPGEASACHKKKCHHKPAPVCEPVVVECAPPVYEPCPPPVPVCEPEPCVKREKRGCGLFKGGMFAKHRKPACAPTPAPCAEVVMVAYHAAPVHYATYAPAPATNWASPQGAAPTATMQAQPKMMPMQGAPAKGTPAPVDKLMPAPPPPAAQTPTS